MEVDAQADSKDSSNGAGRDHYNRTPRAEGKSTGGGLLPRRSLAPMPAPGPGQAQMIVKGHGQASAQGLGHSQTQGSAQALGPGKSQGQGLAPGPGQGLGRSALHGRDWLGQGRRLLPVLIKDVAGLVPGALPYTNLAITVSLSLS